MSVCIIISCLCRDNVQPPPPPLDRCVSQCPVLEAITEPRWIQRTKITSPPEYYWDTKPCASDRPQPGLPVGDGNSGGATPKGKAGGIALSGQAPDVCLLLVGLSTWPVVTRTGEWAGWGWRRWSVFACDEDLGELTAGTCQVDSLEDIWLAMLIMRRDISFVDGQPYTYIYNNARPFVPFGTSGIRRTGTCIVVGNVTTNVQTVHQPVASATKYKGKEVRRKNSGC